MALRVQESLAEVEVFCNHLSGGTDPAQQTQAEKVLSEFIDNPECLSRRWLLWEQGMGTVDHSTIGVMLLSELIQEINLVDYSRPSAKHCKIAASFHDTSLKDILMLVCSLLKEHWEFAPNSVCYSGAKDGGSVPFVKTAEPYLLETYAPQIAKAYITSRLNVFLKL
ncbi:ran-binding protein 17 isoform X1 [Corapipo altera]|uniref:ran-binding protein 17 isoform X1 n=1 Tax=Corapipo altera TaxID=415028 RepID=UPI000FD63B86|nr:ran-binding protein 17 isoform X1 [Corapipo altera]